MYNKDNNVSSWLKFTCFSDDEKHWALFLIALYYNKVLSEGGVKVWVLMLL